MKMHELFATPGTWTQNASAKNRHGQRTGATSDDAHCWCLTGGLTKCYGYHNKQEHRSVERQTRPYPPANRMDSPRGRLNVR